MEEEASKNLNSRSSSKLANGGVMKILVIEDEAFVRKFISDAISGQGYQVWTAATRQEAIEMSGFQQFDLIFCDNDLQEPGSFDLLMALRQNFDTKAEIVLMAEQTSVETAMGAFQYGASDYICKPFSISTLRAIASAVEERHYPDRFIQVGSFKDSQQEITGNSSAIIEALNAAAKAAFTDLAVMISGEVGTGKEMIARFIHRRSARADGPFLMINCGALTDALLESELFGQDQGTLPGSQASRPGLFEEAEGGSILLDEVTETSLAFQAKLLKVIQEGQYRPIGSDKAKRINVRILCATSRDPQILAAQGLFRKDVLYRLQGMSIFLAPLRERREDIKPLALSFLSQFSGGRKLSISKEAMLALESNKWPGNVRELKHLMQQLAARADCVIRLEDLPREIVSASRTSQQPEEIEDQNKLPTLEQVESTYLLRVLKAVGGNKSRAAQVMGVDRKTLYRMIDRHASHLADKDGQS
jgi:DNA-binding NtrC family response regulator